MVDDCPDVFDPGQVDLDGDGIGWVCDPVESVTIANVPGPPFPFPRPGIRNNTFGAVIDSCPPTGGACTAAAQVIVATPYGKVVARSDDPNAPSWVTSDLDGPYITGDEQLIWARSGETGRLDLAADALSIEGSGVPNAVASTQSTGAVLLSLIQQGPVPNILVAPTSSQLVPMATSTYHSVVNGLFPVLDNPPIISVPMDTIGGMYALQTFTPGSTTLDDVIVAGAPATGLSNLILLAPPPPPNLAGFVEIPYCIQRGGAMYYVGIGVGAPTIAPLPYAYCPTGIAARTRSRDSLFLFGQLADGNATMMLVNAGALTTLIADEPVPQGFYFKVIDEAVPVVTIGPDTQNKVWALVSNQAVTITPSLVNGRVSTYGGTVHVVGFQPTGSTTGNLVLYRYRPATGVQQLTLASNTVEFVPNIITTAEGGAIVGNGSSTWLVPSGAMAATPINYSVGLGFARGTGTVFGATENAAPFAHALYAYDEANGVPRMTQLVANASIYARLDPPLGPPTAWLTYKDPTLGCQFAQVVPVNGTPTLANAAPCVNTPLVFGVTNDGSLVVLDAPGGPQVPWDIYVLGTTVAHVAHATKISNGPYGPFVHDFSAWPYPIVGWYGTDAAGGFACLASHPERCWAFPFDSVTQMQASAGASGSDGSFALMDLSYDSASSSSVITILHTLGTGNRPQPM